jgi:GDSL-like Lipase/Acylhydrolase family
MPGPIIVRPGQRIDEPQPAALGPALTLSVTSNAPARFEELYDRREHKWNPKYVFPSEYKLHLNMSRVRPTAQRPLRWHIESLENRFRPIDIEQTRSERVVELGFVTFRVRGVTARLPLAGPVRVTVSSPSGALRTPREYVINVRDYLVVSIGDSYSSGQGNPDQEGVPTVGSEALCELTTLRMIVDKLHDALEEVPGLGELVNAGEEILDGLIEIGEEFVSLFTGEDEFIHMDPPPVWLKPLAWRSLKSSPALAAQSARRPYGRLITFVSVAQSGAEIEDGLLRPQRDFRNVGQIDEVVEMLRNPRDPSQLLRPVDVLMMSIGGNDVGFSGTLSDMTTEKIIIGMLWSTGATQREVRDRIETSLRELPAKYDRLNDVIRDKLDPKVVLIPEYPTALFDGKGGRPTDGCGLFEITGPQGVSKSDAALIEVMGNRLNDVVRDAAARNDWTVATGVARQFKRHGYCSGQSYFVFAEESCNRQDDLEGTMHPNRAGTRVVAQLLGDALRRALDRLDADATSGVRRPPRRPALATAEESPTRTRRPSGGSGRTRSGRPLTSARQLTRSAQRSSGRGPA